MKYSTNILINHSVNNPEISYNLENKKGFAVTAKPLILPGCRITEVLHSQRLNPLALIQLQN